MPSGAFHVTSKLVSDFFSAYKLLAGFGQVLHEVVRLSVLFESPFTTTFTLSSASSFSYLEEGGSQPFPIDRKELAARLDASMQQLSNSEKKVVLMFYYENLSRKEICKILGLEDSEVLRILSGAMEKMQAEMAEYMDIFVKSV